MSLRRKLAIVTLVYVIEGFPMGVYDGVWPVYFRRQGASLAEIGALSLLYVAWSAKVLWSPLVDRYGERRTWIAGSLLAMAACLLAVSASDASRIGPALWLALALYCIGSATQDVAIDAYTIGIVDRGEEGAANSVRFGAYRVGMVLLAGTGLLFLPRWLGWPGTFAAAAALSCALAAAVFACPRVAVPAASRREFWTPLLRWLRRPGVLGVLGFVLLYRVADRAMAPMVKPFWVDRGFSDEEIGVLSAALGWVAALLGAALGGWFVSRFGIYRALAWLGVAALVSNLGYAAAALQPESARGAVIAASLAESLGSGLASVAFLSFLMRICQREHAAVQYALLTAIYALAGSLLAAPSGWLTDRIDYAAYFALTALYALPAFALLPSARAWLGDGDVPPDSRFS